jgi:hypothetical protein
MAINKTIFFLFSTVLIASCDNQADSKKDIQQTAATSIPIRNDTLQEKKSLSVPRSEIQKTKIHIGLKPKKAGKHLGFSNDTKQGTLIDYRPVDQLEIIKLLNSLSEENNLQFKESVAKLNNFINEGLKLQINDWQGTVRSVSVLEHAEMEIEISSPLSLNIANTTPKSNLIHFLSQVGISDTLLVEQLEDLMEGDKVIFSGTIITFGGVPAIQSFTGHTEDVFKHPQIIFKISKVIRIIK